MELNENNLKQAYPSLYAKGGTAKTRVVALAREIGTTPQVVVKILADVLLGYEPNGYTFKAGHKRAGQTTDAAAFTKDIERDVTSFSAENGEAATLPAPRVDVMTKRTITGARVVVDALADAKLLHRAGAKSGPRLFPIGFAGKRSAGGFGGVNPDDVAGLL